MRLLLFNALMWIVLILVLSYAWAGNGPPLRPNPVLTPGAINASIGKAQICDPHWHTKTERPDVDYTTKLKTKQLAARAYPSRNKALYEEDHLIPLEIGGNPTSPKNLWPQVWAGKCGAHVKDRLENKLRELVCAGKVDLNRAQLEIAADWVAAYQKYMGPLSCP